MANRKNVPKPTTTIHLVAEMLPKSVCYAHCAVQLGVDCLQVQAYAAELGMRPTGKYCNKSASEIRDLVRWYIAHNKVFKDLADSHNGDYKMWARVVRELMSNDPKYGAWVRGECPLPTPVSASSGSPESPEASVMKAAAKPPQQAYPPVPTMINTEPIFKMLASYRQKTGYTPGDYVNHTRP